MNYRFDSLAFLSKAIHSSDGEQERGSIQKESFWCFEKQLSKGRSSHLQGVLNKRISVVIQTANKIGATIEAGDTIFYGENEYIVIGVETIKSLVNRRAKEYMIMLE